MKKEKIIDTVSRQSYDRYTFSSGFSLVHYPKKGRFLKAAYLSVGFGSTDIQGQIGGKSFELPEGTAHFLEHKLFEGEEDLFEKMSSLGASVNAFTSHDLTCYYFNTPINFQASLDHLLSIPIKPEYTKEGVIKERNIIGHEIKMYQNDVDYFTYHRGLSYLYPNHPVGNDIAGSLESLERIDKEVLDLALENYYVPSNMLLFLIGDFSEKEMEEILENLPPFYLRKKELAKTIYPEDQIIPSHRQLLSYKDISMASFSYLIKLAAPKSKTIGFEKSIAYTIALDSLFGEGSALYTHHYEKGDLLNLSSDYSYGEGYGVISLSGEGKSPFAIEEGIKKQIIKAQAVDEKKIMRVKRRLMGRYLMGFNSLSGIAGNFTHLHHRGIELFDYLPLVEKTLISPSQELFKGASCFSLTIKEKE
ncbi:MAG TPA: pitrilysin family protein [Clostridia bacterium]|nr:pitrilysin family protein [Clostridia bacterium]